MRLLLHHWLCPHSRKIRLGMAEKKLEFKLQIDNRVAPGHTPGPGGSFALLPVLCEPEGPITHHYAITEFLEERYPERSLFPREPIARAEARRLCGWVGEELYRDVWMKTVFKKVYKRQLRLGAPCSQILRQGLQNLSICLDTIEELCKQRHWLAGDDLSWADMAAGGLLSSLDYLGDIQWSRYPETKSWYARLKSRPCFRNVLADRVPGVLAAPEYANLDF